MSTWTLPTSIIKLRINNCTSRERHRVKLSTFRDKNHHHPFEQHGVRMRMCVCERDDNSISIFGGQFGSAIFLLELHVLAQSATIFFWFFSLFGAQNTRTRFMLFFISSHFCCILDSKLTLTYSNWDFHFFVCMYLFQHFSSVFDSTITIYRQNVSIRFRFFLSILIPFHIPNRLG